LAARIEKRGRIAAEILVSERTYTLGIDVMIKKYMNPLLSHAQSKKPCITEQEAKAIFSIADIILNFHSMFLEGLEARILTWSETTCIGDYFSKMAEFLRCYAQYVNNYDRAMELLEQLEKRPAFAALLAKLTNSEDIKGQSLYSYLIMPIQRPPRYELLLSDLLRHTSEDHNDYANIEKALKLIVTINNAVDEKKKQSDDKKKVLEIDQCIVGPKDESLVVPHRIFIREADLLSGTSTNDVFHVFLFNDLVVITKIHVPPASRKSLHINEKGPQYDFIVKLPLKDCTVSDGFTDDERSFKIHNQSYSFLMTCNSIDEKNTWINDVNEGITANRQRYSVRLAPGSAFV